MGEILEERGGLVKVVSVEHERSTSNSKYTPWIQHAEWFRSDCSTFESCSYLEVQRKVKDAAQLKGLYDKDSDFEDIKSQAEYEYFIGDFKKSAQLWMHLLGKYKIGYLPLQNASFPF